MRSFCIPRALQKGSLREPRPLPTNHAMHSPPSLLTPQLPTVLEAPLQAQTAHAPATRASSCRGGSCCPVVRSAHLRQSFWSLVKLNSIEKISYHLSYSEFLNVFLFLLCSHGHELPVAAFYLSYMHTCMHTCLHVGAESVLKED